MSDKKDRHASLFSSHSTREGNRCLMQTISKSSFNPILTTTLFHTVSNQNVPVRLRFEHNCTIISAAVNTQESPLSPSTAPGAHHSQQLTLSSSPNPPASTQNLPRRFDSSRTLWSTVIKNPRRTLPHPQPAPVPKTSLIPTAHSHGLPSPPSPTELKYSHPITPPNPL